MVVRAPQEDAVVGFAVARALPHLSRQWMLELMTVEPGRAGGGLGGRLLDAAESAVRGRGGRGLVVEISRAGEHPDAGPFLRSRGYAAYDGVGLPKRYTLSQYLRKELEA